MSNKEKSDIVQSLEKFRTDPTEQPRGANPPPFVEGNRRRKWIKHLSISAVFLLVLSLSVTVYANYDRFVGSKKEGVANQPTQVTTPAKNTKNTLVTNKKGSPEAGEAFHVELEEKVAGDLPKKKLTAKNQTSRKPSSTRLSPPPQPKKQDKPAKYDTPIQIPEDYKKRIQNEKNAADETKKKK